MLGLMFGLGVKEVIILTAIFVLFFSVKKIPEIARNIGKAVREIRRSFSDKEDGMDKKN